MTMLVGYGGNIPSYGYVGWLHFRRALRLSCRTIAARTTFRRAESSGVFRSLPESSGVFHSAAPVAVGPSAYWSSPESRALGNVSECVQYVRMCAMRPNVCDVSECVQCVRMCARCGRRCRARLRTPPRWSAPSRCALTGLHAATKPLLSPFFRQGKIPKSPLGCPRAPEVYIVSLSGWNIDFYWASPDVENGRLGEEETLKP